MNLEKLTLEELSSLYQTLKIVCDEYAVMTDTYALTNNDALFETMPAEIVGLVNDRQQMFRFKQIVFNELVKKIKSYFDGQN